MPDVSTADHRPSTLPHWLLAGASGLVFGLGLCLSEMVNPARVIGFLDVASGQWDPTLGIVMAGALAVTIPFFRAAKWIRSPWYADEFPLPTRSDPDANLVIGSVLFGIGWGLAGFCPGPALVATISGIGDVYFFVIAMIAGSLLAGRFSTRK